MHKTFIMETGGEIISDDKKGKTIRKFKWCGELKTTSSLLQKA